MDALKKVFEDKKAQVHSIHSSAAGDQRPNV